MVKFRSFFEVRKIQYEHMIHSIEARHAKIFRICDYFREILRFMNVFTIFMKWILVHKISKF